MRYIQNDSMARLLGDRFNLEATKSLSPPDFCSLIEAGFKEVDGCVVSKEFGLDRVVLDIDETNAEADLSKASLLESAYLSPDTDLSTMVQAGLGFAQLLFDALARSGISGPFRVIVAASSVEGINSCSVRYHRVRDGQSWVCSDLNVYENPTAVLG